MGTDFILQRPAAVTSLIVQPSSALPTTTAKPRRLALLEAAAHPVAVFPDKALRSVAEQRRWEIIAD